jgi:hypothetical protein
MSQQRQSVKELSTPDAGTARKNFFHSRPWLLFASALAKVISLKRRPKDSMACSVQDRLKVLC